MCSLQLKVIAQRWMPKPDKLNRKNKFSKVMRTMY